MGLDEVKKQYLKSTQAVGIDLPLPKLQTLFELTWSNDSSEIISILENDEPKNKGELFEQYLGLLYFHLGHRVSVTRKGKDNGVDIVIYDDSENIIKLISAKNWNKRIDRPNMLKEIQLFKSYIDSTPLTVQPYKEVFSLNGFTKEAKSIERYNVVVKDSHTLADMIQNAYQKSQAYCAIATEEAKSNPEKAKQTVELIQYDDQKSLAYCAIAAALLPQ